MKLQFRLGPLRHYCPGEALVLAEAHQMLSKLKGKIFLNQLSQIIDTALKTVEGLKIRESD